MEYWVNINQVKSIEWDLSIQEAMLCSFFSRDNSWVRNKWNDVDGEFVYIAPTKIFKEMPLLKSDSNIRKILDNLVRKNIFSKCSDLEDKKSFYKFYKKYQNEWKCIEDIPSVGNNSNGMENIPSVGNNSNGMENIPTGMENIPTGMENIPTGMENIPMGVRKYSNNHINHNHINHNQKNHNQKNHNHKLVDDEFKRLASIYPVTENRTEEKESLALGVFRNFNNAERFMWYKAVRHYANTEYVYSKRNDRGFIPNIHTFFTKKDISKIMNMELRQESTENFDKKNEEVGVAGYYNENETLEYIKLVGQFKKIIDEKIRDLASIEEILGNENFKIFYDKVGVERLDRFTSEAISTTIVDSKKDIDD